MKKIILILFLILSVSVNSFAGIGFYGNPTPVVIHKGTNAPVLVKLFDVDNSLLTAAEIAAITKIEVYYRPDTGATPETVDSTSYAAGFDKTTYAARGEIMLKIGLVDFTAGRDRQAELIIYNATYTSGRVIGLLDMQISDEVEDGAILTDPLTGIAYKFKTISVAGQSSVVADSDIDTVTLIAGANVTLTTDPATDSITIAVDNGGGLADAPSDGTEYLRKDGAWVNPSASGSMVYPEPGIPLSTGSAWGTPITNNSASWNMAYGWGDHALGGYVTGTPWTAMGYLTAETDPDFTTWLSTFIDQTEDADADPTNEIQVADGVTITGAGTLADPFVAVGGAGAPEADPVFGEWLLSFDPFETGDETDPSFSTWLSTTPPIYTETDPDFATWLLSYDPFETADETDPVFGAWLIATPPLYSESDPAVGTHESTYDHDLIASALQSESDPDFTTWLSTTPPLYTETDPAVGTHESTYDHTLIGTALQSESDPTVDTSAEIVSIIGAGVYQAPGAYLTSLSGAVLTDQTTPQTIGATGSRLAMCWATDLTVTNAINGSVTGNAGTVTNGVYVGEVLKLNNTTEFTPDADYEPATKKYVDDNSGGSITEISVSSSTSLTVTGDTVVDNSGQSAAITTTMPTAPSSTVFVQFMITSPTETWYIAPATGTCFYLGGTQLAANHKIVNNGAGAIFQDSILFMAKQDASSNWVWVVYVIQGTWTDGGL
ncbi:MAG: hypothetical protein WBN66_02285 [Smithella sp.]